MNAAAVALPGVRAHTPMGLLVALGALDLLAEHADPAARLSWGEDERGYRAMLSAGKATTTAALAALVFESLAADRVEYLRDVAPDLNLVMPEALHHALSQPVVPRVLSGLCAEAPLRTNGCVAMTPLAITSFKGRRSVFATIIRADGSVAEKHIRALLQGPWTYAPKVPTLSLDPAAREQDSARMAADASADGTRGVPGSLSLAARGLALVPPLPAAGGRPRVGALRGGTFTWPVWILPVTRFGARALMGRAWGADDEAVRSACGVAAVYESEVVAAKDGRRLARARRLA